MNVKLDIDAPLLNDGQLHEGTTWELSRDLEFTDIILNLYKTRDAEPDKLLGIELDVDSELDKFFLRVKYHMTGDIVSDWSDPLVINSNVEESHTHDALLIVPTLEKEGVFEFGNSIKITTSSMEHIKRTPNQLDSTWKLIDTTGNYLVQEIHRDSLTMNDFTVPNYSTIGREDNIMTVSCIQRDIHGETAPGEIILNEYDDVHTLELKEEPILYSNIRTIFTLDSDILIKNRFGYVVRDSNNDIVYESIDLKEHIVLVPSDFTIPIISGNKYTITITMHTDLGRTINKAFELTANDRSMSNVTTGLSKINLNKPTIDVTVSTNVTGLHTIELPSRNIPIVNQTDDAIRYFKYFDSIDTPEREYMATGSDTVSLPTDISINASTIITDIGNNFYAFNTVGNDGRIGIGVIDHLTLNTHSSLHRYIISDFVTGAINDAIIPTFAMANSTDAYMPFIDGGVFKLEVLNILSPVVPSVKVIIPAGITNIVSNPNIKNIDANHFMIWGNKDASTTSWFIVNNNMDIVNSGILNYVSDTNGVIMYYPTVDGQVDTYGLTGVFAYVSPSNITLDEYLSNGVFYSEVNGSPEINIAKNTIGTVISPDNTLMLMGL